MPVDKFGCLGTFNREYQEFKPLTLWSDCFFLHQFRFFSACAVTNICSVFGSMTLLAQWHFCISFFHHVRQKLLDHQKSVPPYFSHIFSMYFHIFPFFSRFFAPEFLPSKKLQKSATPLRQLGPPRQRSTIRPSLRWTGKPGSNGDGEKRGISARNMWT